MTTTTGPEAPWWRSLAWWRDSPLAERDNVTLVVLMVLVLVDLVFIVLTALDFREVLDLSDTMHVTTDRGWPERWGYLKLAGVAAALWSSARGDVRLSRRSVAGIALVLLADDALRLHEDLGREIAEGLGFPAVLGLRVKDLGELLVYAVLGAIILFLLWRAHRHVPPREAWFVRATTVALALLAAVAIGGDLFAEATEDVAFIEGQWAVEDGGELMVVSLLAALVLRLRRATAPPA